MAPIPDLCANSATQWWRIDTAPCRMQQVSRDVNMLPIFNWSLDRMWVIINKTFFHAKTFKIRLKIVLLTDDAGRYWNIGCYCEKLTVCFNLFIQWTSRHKAPRVPTCKSSILSRAADSHVAHLHSQARNIRLRRDEVAGNESFPSK